tara:strand:+ start:210 stop:533 length:324 start_codon:yes stop_codon:yes gene_type:complete
MKTLKELKQVLGLPIAPKTEQNKFTKMVAKLDEDVIATLRTISKKKKEMNIKFASGTEVPIDPDSANVLLKTYDSLNSSNKKKMQMNMNKDTKSFMKVLDFAFSNAK